MNGDGNPTGTVTVKAGATTLCTDTTLTASGAFSATYSCPISSATLLAASGTAYSVTATFGGGNSSNTNFTYTASTSTPAQNLTVNAASVATSTSLTAITSPITYGSEATETFTGTVTGVNGDGNPTGTVTVKAGATTLCTDTTLTASGAFSATYSCPISSDTLLAASGTAYSVTATFGGGNSSNTNFTYTASTSTPAQNLTVNTAAVATSTSLTAITSPITYGSEATETFTGTVTGVNGDGNPTGTVTVKAGRDHPVHRHHLDRQRRLLGHLQLPDHPATLLAASGTAYSVTATFGGGNSSNYQLHLHGLDLEPAQNLTVNAAAVATSTSARRHHLAQTYGSEATETFTGTVTGVNGDGNPTGHGHRQDRGDHLCTDTTLTASGAFSATYSCPISLGHLAGRLGHRLLGDRHLRRRELLEHQLHLHGLDLEPAQNLTVNAAAVATSTSLTTVTSPITYGSEATETFTGTVTGVNGDGNPTGTGDRQGRGDHLVHRHHLDRQRRLLGHLQLPDLLGHLAGRLGHRLLGDRHLRRRGHLEHQLHLHGLDLDAGSEPHGQRGSRGDLDLTDGHHLAHHLWLGGH